MRTVIFGSGGFGREVSDVLRAALAEGLELLFASDDGAGSMLDIPILPSDQLGQGDTVIIAIGDGETRRSIEERLLAQGCEIGSAVARTAIVSPYATIGTGAVISDHVLINAATRIGRQFQCNIYAYVAHDCTIGDFVTFAPKVCCNGNVTIGDNAYIGTGAMLRQGISIGAGAVIGMGAVVVKDVPAGVTVAGNPAQPLVRKTA
ncbi:MAG: acetyltransferase [Sphingopyxis terrae]|nr:acetyltransferase [Sphingopyxis terrae]